MDSMVGQFVLPLLGAASGGIAAYVAIKSDLSALKAVMVIMQESVKRAHERIDSIKDGK